MQEGILLSVPYLAHLGKAEEQSHVAVDALLLQPPARLNALPGGGQLDVDASAEGLWQRSTSS